MFNEQSKHIYTIALPASTANEVIEWFEMMDTNGKLANILVELVNDMIKTGKALESSTCPLNNQSEPLEPLANLTVNQNDFLDSLYDWQGSSNAAFKEEKAKKKMLYV